MPYSRLLIETCEDLCQCIAKDEVLTLSTAYEVGYELVMIQLL